MYFAVGKFNLDDRGTILLGKAALLCLTWKTGERQIGEHSLSGLLRLTSNGHSYGPSMSGIFLLAMLPCPS